MTRAAHGSPPNRRTRIRPFTETDVDAVAALHRIVFPNRTFSMAGRLEDHARYFSAVFLSHPWTSLGIPSLVYEQEDGCVGGFIGVVPRPLLVNGEEVTAAVSTQLVVHPDLRSKLVGVQLMRAFLEGEQDISIADEANDEARRLWEGLGGTTLLLPSISWIRILRPSSHYWRRLSHRLHLGWLSLQLLAGAADRVSTRLRSSPFALQRTPGTSSETLTVDRLHDWLGQVGTTGRLAGRFSLNDLHWILNRDTHRQGSFVMRMVRCEDGQPCGCHVLFVDAAGTAEVVFFDAVAGRAHDVFASILVDANEAGAETVGGRMEASLIVPVATSRSLFDGSHRWVLVASKRSEILAALHRGDATLSKLEGEYPLRFR